jgi:hypothetical protein
MLSIGNQPDRIQALINGVVDAADLSPSRRRSAERKGFKICGTQSRRYPIRRCRSLHARKWVAEIVIPVMRMVKAHVEGIHFLKANKRLQYESSKQIPQNQRPRAARRSRTKFIARISSRFPTRSPRGCSRPMNMSPSSAPKFGIKSPTRSWTQASSPSSRKAASSERSLNSSR